MSNFSCAKRDANKLEQRNWLINIRPNAPNFFILIGNVLELLSAIGLWIEVTILN
jgi:hypothetical protein